MKPHVVAVILTLALLSTAHAGSFAVTPVRIELSPARPYSVVQITNQGGEAVLIQAHVERWEAGDGSEQRSDEVLLNPPFRTIAPGQSQFIRLGLRTVNQSGKEQAYRLVLEEVPRPVAAEFSGLRTVLRVRIPVFSKPASPVAAQLNWEAWPTSTGVRVVAWNRGNAHIQVRRLVLIDKTGKQFIVASPSYVMPDQSGEWAVNEEHFLLATELRLMADTDAGGINEVLPLKQRH
jgi:fimbrial chaperone protein